MVIRNEVLGCPSATFSLSSRVQCYYREKRVLPYDFLFVYTIVLTPRVECDP